MSHIWQPMMIYNQPRAIIPINIFGSFKETENIWQVPTISFNIGQYLSILDNIGKYLTTSEIILQCVKISKISNNSARQSSGAKETNLCYSKIFHSIFVFFFTWASSRGAFTPKNVRNNSWKLIFSISTKKNIM